MGPRGGTKKKNPATAQRLDGTWANVEKKTGVEQKKKTNWLKENLASPSKQKKRGKVRPGG